MEIADIVKCDLTQQLPLLPKIMYGVNIMYQPIMTGDPNF